MDGLPAGAETTSDTPISSGSFLASALDRTRNQVEETVSIGKPDLNFFDSKESLSSAVRSVMDKDSELGNLVRRNHAKWKESLVSTGLMNGYVNKFIEALQKLV